MRVSYTFVVWCIIMVCLTRESFVGLALPMVLYRLAQRKDKDFSKGG